MVSSKLDKLCTFLLASFALNFLYILTFPFLTMYLIFRMEECLVDQTMIIISIVYEILVILLSLLLSYKLNYGGDE
jgi:hypothetical protein